MTKIKISFITILFLLIPTLASASSENGSNITSSISTLNVSEKGKFIITESQFRDLPESNFDSSLNLLKDGSVSKIVYLTNNGSFLIVINNKTILKLPFLTQEELVTFTLESNNLSLEITKAEISPDKVAENPESSGSLPPAGMFIIGFLFFGIGVIIFLKHRSDEKERAKLKKLREDEVTYMTREGAGVIPKVTFEDVAGCDEAINDLREMAEFLKDPEKFKHLGAKIPRGAILVGPPGTGKTLLARAVAGEAKVPFFSASGSDFVEMYVGVGPMRIRELFAKAKASERAIVFIDEIDAVARARSMNSVNPNEEREATLNALLHELDGFSKSNVILLAATNRVDILDPAITRPGRLDRKIQVPNPDRRGRELILSIHASDKPLSKDVDLSLVARRTPGMSGADLEQVCNEAAIEASRRNLKSIDASCFSDAVAVVAMGRARKSALVTDRDRLITAWHEAGHTICALISEDSPDPVSVSITPRGHAGGITWMGTSDDQFLSRKEALSQLLVAMGGRAGEELLLEGEFTQGASSDLERATKLAGNMVSKYGMTRRGLMFRDDPKDEATLAVTEEILREALEGAREVLRENRDKLEMLVNALLISDTLEYNEILELLSSNDKDFLSFKNRAERLLLPKTKKVSRKKKILNEVKELEHQFFDSVNERLKENLLDEKSRKRKKSSSKKKMLDKI